MYIAMCFPLITIQDELLPFFEIIRKSVVVCFANFMVIYFIMVIVNFRNRHNIKTYRKKALNVSCHSYYTEIVSMFFF